ncbi:MAG: hypothetical protein JSW71_16685 [Gemmatimonadota bacterium]|nr:MAG: hypothetical protein JSW71_16685 [Gemmatimonadota bacterium]
MRNPLWRGSVFGSLAQNLTAVLENFTRDVRDGVREIRWVLLKADVS